MINSLGKGETLQLGTGISFSRPGFYCRHDRRCFIATGKTDVPQHGLRKHDSNELCKKFVGDCVSNTVARRNLAWHKVAIGSDASFESNCKLLFVILCRLYSFCV